MYQDYNQFQPITVFLEKYANFLIYQNGIHSIEDHKQDYCDRHKNNEKCFHILDENAVTSLNSLKGRISKRIVVRNWKGLADPLLNLFDRQQSPAALFKKTNEL